MIGTSFLIGVPFVIARVVCLSFLPGLEFTSFKSNANIGGTYFTKK
jgi:hypothetical protein